MTWRCAIFRVVIYSILFCLIVLTAYLYINKSGEEQDENKITSQVNDPVKPSKLVPLQVENQNSSQMQNEPFKSSESLIPLIHNQDLVKTEQDNKIAANAMENFKRGDYENAIKFFKELSEKDKGTLVYIGISYFKLGDYHNAISFLEKAVEYNHKDFTARKALAFSYYKTDDLEKGFHNAEIGLSIKKDPELQAFYDKLKREKQTQQGYIEESTSYFKVLFDGHEHGKVDREVISILDEAYRFVGKELDYFPTERITVILYTRKDFYDTTQAPVWSEGIYDGKIRLPIKGIEGQSASLKKVLFHEYTHAVVHSLTPRCPLWIHEGLAEHFSTHYPKKIGQIIPLSYLEKSFSGLRGENIRIAYWESYSAVSYLIEKYGLFRMKELFLSLSKGTDINQAFRYTFSITYNEFVSGWGKN